jgi:hypothetical protein
MTTKEQKAHKESAGQVAALSRRAYSALSSGSSGVLNKLQDER